MQPPMKWYMVVALSMHNNTKMILQDTLYCAACDKEMRNEKAFATHQKSSKHLENVERLKELLREEEGMLEGSSSDASGLFTVHKHFCLKHDPYYRLF